MPARNWTILTIVLVLLLCASQASADWFCGIFTSIVHDFKERNRWPAQYTGADQAAARAPYCTMVANGWRRQNMLGEFHFQPGTGQLTEAGRMKVRWILTAAPEQRRLIYVHTATTIEETAARMANVRQFACRVTPNQLAPVLSTSISDEGSPADQIDLIGRKYQATTPPPRLPADATAGGGSSGNSGSTPH